MVPGLKKEKNSIFGYKLHQKTNIDHCLIREIEITTAKVNDSQIDLSVKGGIVLRDRAILEPKRRVRILP
jgi:hypothetical protein